MSASLEPDGLSKEKTTLAPACPRAILPSFPGSASDSFTLRSVFIIDPKKNDSWLTTGPRFSIAGYSCYFTSSKLPPAVT
jgi:hypothetical protein